MYKYVMNLPMQLIIHCPNTFVVIMELSSMIIIITIILGMSNYTHLRHIERRSAAVMERLQLVSTWVSPPSRRARSSSNCDTLMRK